MRLSDMIQCPRVASPFGVVRPHISPKPHTGVDWVSDVSPVTRLPVPSRVVWQFNNVSPLTDAARRQYFPNGAEWPYSWYFAFRYGLMVIIFPKGMDECLVLCHFNLLRTIRIAEGLGAEFRDTYNRTKYNVWQHFYSNLHAPLDLPAGTIIGEYGRTGNSEDAHIHGERRRLSWGESSGEAWEDLDAMELFV